jgi:hypothetical protein
MPEISRHVGSLVLLLDNQPNAMLRSLDGGGISAEVITETQRAGQPVAGKRLGPVRYEEVVIETGLGMGAALHDWITRAWSGEAPLGQAAVAITDADGVVRTIRHFDDARLTQVTFPALDAASKDAGWLRIRLQPGQTRTESPTDKAALDVSGLRAVKWLTLAFRLSVDGMERAGMVVQIDPFGFRQPVPADAVGPQKPYTAIAPPSFSNLRITVPEREAAPWLAWHEDAVVKGNSGPSSERSGQITLLDQAMKQQIGRIELHNLGIFRVAPMRQEPGTVVTHVVVELYCERMTFAPPA